MTCRFVGHYSDREGFFGCVYVWSVCCSMAHLSALRLERRQPLISGWNSCGEALEGLSLHFIEGL